MKHRHIISLQVKNLKQQKSNILILVFKTLGGYKGLLACKVAGAQEGINYNGKRNKTLSLTVDSRKVNEIK